MRNRIVQIVALTGAILLSVPVRNIQAQVVPEQSVMAVLWFQRSAEYRALCYQAYNLAELRVKEYLANPDSTLRPAVIFDIDETVLDNSPHEAGNILTGKGFNASDWKVWTDKASAAAIPGSLEFCQYLQKQGIAVIYISNRQENELASTLLNLRNLGFPDADSSHLFLKSGSSGKEARRNRVAEKYRVILLVGDNLSDFSRLLEDRTQSFGYPAVDSMRQEMGKKFIVLPNPMYGDWTRPLSGDRKSWLNTGR